MGETSPTLSTVTGSDLDKRGDFKMGRPIQNSLLSLVPDIGEYLVSDIDPSNISGKNRVHYSFKCRNCGKIFERAVGDYTSGLGLCQDCTKRYTSQKYSRAKAVDNSLLQWFVAHNLDLPEVVSQHDLSVIAKGSHTKIRFRCKLGHEFTMSAYNVIQGYWCPFCSRSKRISKPSLCLYMYLIKYKKCVLEYNIPGTRLSLDIYIESMKVGIEFDGQRYHHNLDRDFNKDIKCRDLGISVIHIREPKCPPMQGENAYTLSSPVYSWKDLDECRYWLCQKLNIRAQEFSFETSWNDVYSYLYNGRVPNNAYIGICKCRDNDILVSTRQRAESLGVSENRIKLEFKCIKCGYRYSVTPYNYIQHHSRCPVCAGHVVNDINSLAHSSIAEEYSAFNVDRIEDVHIRSSKKCIFVCKYRHYYEATAEMRNTAGRNTGCPICSNNITLAGFNDLETWYPVMYRMIQDNVAVLPINSKRVLNFKCEICGTVFASAPINMHKRRHYCPNWRNHEKDIVYIEQVRAYR